MATILDLRTTSDPRDMVHACVQTLVEGGVIGVPTETVYGLAASALSETAVRRLYEIKQGQAEFPVAISVSGRDAAMDFLCDPSPLVRRLSQRCWPGPMTLVAPCDLQRSAASQLPEKVRQSICSSTGDGAAACIGFRVVDHRIISHIHRFLAAPLLLTSANLPGQDAVTTTQAVNSQLGDSIALLLDDGPTRYGGPSTVVRVQGNEMRILREGVIEQEAMNQFAKPMIVLVCTGNTCRSPMAEVLLRQKLTKKMGSPDAVTVLSAGVAAASGSGAADQAVEVMKSKKLDLSGHAARVLDDSVMNAADLVLTMTRGHRAAILAAWPTMHDRVFTLRRDGGDISDPVGLPLEIYASCADQMDKELDAWIETLGNDFFPQAVTP